MDIIKKLLEHKIKDDILKFLKDRSLFSKDHLVVNTAKRELRKNSGVIFINIMPSDNRIYKVMAKTTTTTLVYEYNSNTETLIMKGDRNNVIS